MLQCGLFRSNFALPMTCTSFFFYARHPDRRANQPLSGQGLERVKGIEPSSSAWKAVALPLSYTRVGNRISDFRSQNSMPEAVSHLPHNSRSDILTCFPTRFSDWWGR